MYRHLAIVFLIHSFLPLHTFKVDALAVVPQRSINTAIETPSTLNLISPQIPPNHTSTPLQDSISYHVPNSPITLLLHAFGSPIPSNEFLRVVALAVGIIYDLIDDGKGTSPISQGLFVYSHQFLNDDKVVITVGDFRESDRPMNYLTLRDALRGVGEFILMRRRAEELQFEVEVEDMGYLGTGHVDFKAAMPSTSAVAL